MVASINGALNSISTTVSTISTQEQNAGLLYNFLESDEDELKLLPMAKKISQVESLEMKNVWFYYSNQPTPALKNISLKINQGDKISIVGYNGAGKTTLVKLLLMFNMISEGEYRINGKSCDEIDYFNFWNNCSVLMQDHTEYSVSIGENVLMEKVSNENEDLVWESIEKAGLKDKVLSFENGINTQFTRLFFEDGVEFSGGERQKLSISRVVAKNASLIILDEPSSALDPSYEDELNDYIESLPKDKTVIVISHRLSSVKACNRVVFMKDGSVVADGTHEQVYSKCADYRDMFEKQLRRFSVF